MSRAGFRYARIPLERSAAFLLNGLTFWVWLSQVCGLQADVDLLVNFSIRLWCMRGVWASRLT